MTERTFGTLWGRALRLSCPRCGDGPLFVGWFRMHEHCSHCNLKYERSPGYFLGSTYFNYGQTAAITTAVYMTLVFGFDVPKAWVAVPLGLYCLLWPLFWFRFARSLWMGFDCFCDPTDFETDDPNVENEVE